MPAIDTNEPCTVKGCKGHLMKQVLKKEGGKEQIVRYWCNECGNKIIPQYIKPIRTPSGTTCAIAIEDFK